MTRTPYSIVTIHEAELNPLANWLTALHCATGATADNVVNSDKRCGKKSFGVELEECEKF